MNARQWWTSACPLDWDGPAVTEWDGIRVTSKVTLHLKPGVPRVVKWVLKKLLRYVSELSVTHVVERLESRNGAKRRIRSDSE
ncbi:MAG: hypothetical protein IMZ55_15095 [Acidobacteria bacterium]|nr:hypothetical protein [Acidobacteriota bacterium]